METRLCSSSVLWSRRKGCRHPILSERFYHGVYWTLHELYCDSKGFDKKSTKDKLEMRTCWVAECKSGWVFANWSKSRITSWKRHWWNYLLSLTLVIGWAWLQAYVLSRTKVTTIILVDVLSVFSLSSFRVGIPLFPKRTWRVCCCSGQHFLK